MNDTTGQNKNAASQSVAFAHAPDREVWKLVLWGPGRPAMLWPE